MMNENQAFSRVARMPAEWESCFSRVLIAWPHVSTDWMPMLSDAVGCYRDIVKALVNSARMDVVIVAPRPDIVFSDLGDVVDLKHIEVVECPTNDTWTRDYGPLTVETVDGRLELLDFGFNAWGLKFAAGFDNVVNRRLDSLGVFNMPLQNHNDFILEGGSVESDGAGTIMTTSRCLLEANRNSALDREKIEDRLKVSLGGNRVLWIEHGGLDGDDTDGHIDTLARFAPGNTIIYTGAGDKNDNQYTALDLMAKELGAFRTADGLPYNLVELPLPDPVTDPDDGSRLPATYANFLVTPHAVLVPTYNQPQKDWLAMQTIKIAYPDREITGVDCRALVRQHGSLHCVTMQLPSKNVVS